MDEMKDFSRPRKRIMFRIDGDEFEAAPAIPAEVFIEFTTRYEGMGNESGLGEQCRALASALQLVMMPDSYDLLKRRMNDLTNPVEADQLADIVLWLLEEYGNRPTQPSSESSDGSLSQESGTSSTESTQVVELTSDHSPLIAS